MGTFLALGYHLFCGIASFSILDLLMAVQVGMELAVLGWPVYGK